MKKNESWKGASLTVGGTRYTLRPESTNRKSRYHSHLLNHSLNIHFNQHVNSQNLIEDLLHVKSLYLLKENGVV